MCAGNPAPPRPCSPEASICAIKASEPNASALANAAPERSWGPRRKRACEPNSCAVTPTCPFQRRSAASSAFLAATKRVQSPPAASTSWWVTSTRTRRSRSTAGGASQAAKQEQPLAGRPLAWACSRRACEPASWQERPVQTRTLVAGSASRWKKLLVPYTWASGTPVASAT